jgi:hypothetical protein
VDIAVGVDRVTRTTFQVPYLLTVDGDVRSTAVTVHGSVDHEGRATRLPAWMSDVAQRAGGG